MYGILAAIVGALTALQSRLNGQLSKDIHNGIAAALVSFGVGYIALIIITAVSLKDRQGLIAMWSAVKHGRLKWWELIGGMGGGFFVAVQATTVPIIGVGIFTICIIGGQTASSLLVDKWGISPRGKQLITLPRVFAAVMTLIAVTVAVYPDLGKSTFKFAPVFFGLLVGGIVSFQQALNSRVNEHTKRPIASAWLNFLMGTFVLSIALAIDLARGATIGALPHQWWVYMGGPIGLIFISVSAFTIKHTGVLNFLMFSVSGQLFGAILLDWLAPTRGKHVTS
jgi:transporter family-2 protein